MKRTTTTTLILILLAGLMAACERRNENAAGANETATIAPAPAMPAETGTDAMTQTLGADDLVEGRSENEGGAITSPNPPVRTATSGSPPPPATGTTATTATTTTRQE